MQEYFDQIQNEMQAAYTGVASGNMMRSPALTYKSKVFAFFFNDEMGFKLDAKAADFKELYPGSKYLSPFKKKPPLKGWLVVPGTYHNDWNNLALEAYKNLAEK